MIFSVILYSCNDFTEKKVLNELFSQDFEKFKAENKLEAIDLDSVGNFSELRKKMGKITCKEKVSGLKFEFTGTLYHITAYADCPTSSVISCYFRRNLLTIINDSLVIEYGKENKKAPIEYLKAELENIIKKPYNFQYNEDKVKPALIRIFIEDKYPISTTKKVLKEIAEQFKNINSGNKPDFFKYNILFESYDITSIPLPPPPPKPNKFEHEY